MEKHKEQVRKVLKFIEMKKEYQRVMTFRLHLSVQDDHYHHHFRRSRRRRETSGADKRSVGKNLRRNHVLALQSDVHEKYGHGEVKPDWKGEPATLFSEFSPAGRLCSRIHNDGGLSLYSPSVGIRPNLLQHKPVVFSQTTTTVFYSVLQVSPFHSNLFFQRATGHTSS